jgi:cytochrome P450
MRWMQELARRYPDGFQLRVPGSQHAVFLTRPEHIEQLFSLDGQTAAAGKANSILRPVLGDNSLLLLDGPRHLRERKMMMPPFHGDRMRAYADTVRAIAEENFTAWPQGQTFTLHDRLQELTLEVIFRVVFGVERGPGALELRNQLRQFLNFAMKPSLLLLVRPDGRMRGAMLQRAVGSWSPSARLEELSRQTDEVLFAELARRRADPAPREDILSLLLSVRDEQGQPMTDRELRDELLTLLVAGHETTATSLGFTLLELIQNPAVLERAREELAREVGSAPVEAAHLPRLRYLDAIISESLRLRPVLPIVARLLERPVKLGPYSLPAGTLVCPCIYVTHRRPELYPEPEAFRPERFLENPPSPSAYFPFGGGIRRCIGRAFALFEMKVVLAHLLSRVSLELAPGYQPRVVRRSITFTASQKLPVRVRLHSARLTGPVGGSRA